jgi:hypothetical protein
VTALPSELRELIASGPMAHLSTVNADGSPQERSDNAWDLLDRLTKTYVAPGATFPAPRGPGYIVRYAVGRVGGVGPWAARA